MWKVGNSETISFWYDNWVENKNLIDLLNLHEDTIHMPQAKVSEFIHPNRSSDVAKLNLLLNNHFVTEKIEGIPIPAHSKQGSF